MSTAYIDQTELKLELFKGSVEYYKISKLVSTVHLTYVL